MSQTIAQLAVDSLISNGIENLYCLPGVQNDDFFNTLYDRQDELRPIQSRHEQGAAYMALGAALATGKPQAFCIVPGPGFLNGCAALCTAYSLNAPLFALIGQIPSRAIGKGLGLLHEIEGQLEIMGTMTKWCDRVVDGSKAVDQFRTAWTEMQSGRPGPVGLEIPVDIWTAETSFEPSALTIAPPANRAPDATEIAAAADLIRQAKRPLIVVGRGAQDVSQDVRSFAKEISAGVVHFRSGQGVMRADDDQCIGIPVAHALWPDCDLVIGLGSRLMAQKVQWGMDDALKILHIDLDPDVLTRMRPADVGIEADLIHAMPLLNAAVKGQQPDRNDWLDEVRRAKERKTQEYVENLAPQIGWLSAIRDVLPENGILVDELTQIGYVSRFAHQAFEPRTFLSSGFQGTLGWGIAAALGAAHARQDVPVVSICGDGGAMFTIAELSTARHHKIPLTVIVMNDNAYGNVRSIQRDNYQERYIASDLISPDFVKLAESCGVKGERAATPDELRSVLADAIATDEPTVIEVPQGQVPSPWDYVLLPKVRG